MIGQLEFEIVVEYSFNAKQKHFVVRFLDGSSYILSIKDLPKQLQTKKPDWSNTMLSEDKTSILVPVGKKLRNIPFNIIHARGIPV